MSRGERPLYLSTVRKQRTGECAWQGRACVGCGVCTVWGECQGHGDVSRHWVWHGVGVHGAQRKCECECEHAWSVGAVTVPSPNACVHWVWGARRVCAVWPSVHRED